MKTITILTAIITMSLATAMYGGENYSFETNLTNPVYIVNGNSSNLDGLNIYFEDNLITLFVAPNMKPDNFTLTFFDNLTKEIIKEVYVGGGGSRTKYVEVPINQTKLIYVNKEQECEEKVCEQNKSTEPLPEIIPEPKEVVLIEWIIIIGMILFAMATIYYLITRGSPEDAHGGEDGN